MYIRIHIHLYICLDVERMKSSSGSPGCGNTTFSVCSQRYGVTVCCSVLQRVLQRVAMGCSMLQITGRQQYITGLQQHMYTKLCVFSGLRVLQRFAVFGSVLQCFAMCCSVYK